MFLASVRARLPERTNTAVGRMLLLTLREANDFVPEREGFFSGEEREKFDEYGIPCHPS